MMVAATQQQAEAFLAFMAQHFGARIVRRKDAPEYALIKQGLEAIGIGGSLLDTVLAGRSITLGNLVYLDDSLSADDIFECCTHECQHIVQENHNGFLKNAWRYIAYTELRVALEVDAYAAGASVTYARWKTLPPVDEMSARMGHGYFLSGKDLALAKDLFEQRVTSIAAGVVDTESAKAAIDWLRTHAPELLA